MKNWTSNAKNIRSLGIIAAVLSCSIATSASLAQSTWTYVSGYRSTADSTFPVATLLVENFEGLPQPGMTIASGSTEILSVSLGNSVDADDASLDGNGATGKSLTIGNWDPFDPGFASISFSAKALGSAPTRVGFVVTDSSGMGFPAPVTITVYFADSTTESMVVEVLSAANDASDDLFIGLENLIGVDTITVSSIIPLAIDHVQFDAPLAAVPAMVRDDFDLDGKSDVPWFNAGASKSTLWNMDGLTRIAGRYTTLDPTGLKPRGTGDLNADRRSDLVWREESTGRFAAWIMNNTTVAQQGYISGPLDSAWDIIAMGDLNGDRRADCILRNSSTGEVRGWLMDGLVKIAGGHIGSSTGLKFLGVGDFNADGKDDLLWQDGGTAVYGWQMDGLAISLQSAIANACAPGNGWKTAGVADLDADGRSDVVWHHESLGLVSGWLMDGLSRRTGAYISTTVGSGWKIIATPDLDGDGKRDILWRNNLNGDVNGWLMNGLVKSSGGFIRAAEKSWTNIK